MTPGWLSVLLPIVQTFGAWLVARRISWKHHPALITYLLTEALWQPLAWWGVPLAPWARVAQLPIRTAVVFEVLTYSRIALTPKQRAACVAFALALAAGASSATPGLTTLQALYLMRSYYHLALSAALLAVAIARYRRPLLESRRHTAYRLGMAAWLAVVAVAGSFVRGGLGYKLLPYNRGVWEAVNLATYVALILVIGAMAAAMTARAAAPRKVAAQRADAWRVRRMAA